MARWAPFGRGQIRRTSDGQYEYRRTERTRESLEAAAEARKEAARDPKSAECKEGGRMIAEMTPLQHSEMKRQCGNDPEKRMMYLRDHPETLLVPAQQVKLPKKRIISFPKKVR